MLPLLLFEEKKSFKNFYLDTDQSMENITESNTYHAALDKLIQTALSSGKQSVQLNITSDPEQNHTDTLIKVITTDIDIENNEQNISRTDNQQSKEKRNDEN